MLAPIALQLYTLREALAHDFAGAVHKVAEIGFVGVETAGFPGTTPKEARKLFDDLGLTISSAHTALPLADKKNEVLDMLAQLDCSRMVCPMLGPDDYNSLDQIYRTCDLINKAQTVAAENNLSLGIHNHQWEYQLVEGQYPYQILEERLDPAVFFQIDTYWVKTAGIDPVEVVRQMGARASLLHIKDGPCQTEVPQVAVGRGVMDIAAVIEAGGQNTEWLIVELDQCATDMFQAVKQSYEYLVSNGLAQGK